MKKATIDDIIGWNPCEEYPRERILELMDGSESVSVIEMLGWDVPADDKLWGVLRPFYFSDEELRLMAADFAEAVLPLFEKEHPNDKRPWEAIKSARMFARGEITVNDLAAARAAAWDAAWDAASDAASDAARAAARDAQLNIVRKYLEAK